MSTDLSRIPHLVSKPTGLRPGLTWGRLIEALEKNGAILWEPGEYGVHGWAVCPCCGDRELEVRAP